jgi:hypothetical protein
MSPLNFQSDVKRPKGFTLTEAVMNQKIYIQIKKKGPLIWKFPNPATLPPNHYYQIKIKSPPQILFPKMFLIMVNLQLRLDPRLHPPHLKMNPWIFPQRKIPKLFDSHISPQPRNSDLPKILNFY